MMGHSEVINNYSEVINSYFEVISSYFKENFAVVAIL